MNVFIDSILLVGITMLFAIVLRYLLRNQINTFDTDQKGELLSSYLLLLLLVFWGTNAFGQQFPYYGYVVILNIAFSVGLAIAILYFKSDRGKIITCSIIGMILPFLCYYIYLLF